MSRAVVSVVSLLASSALLAAICPAALHAQASIALHAGRGPDVGAPWLYGATLGVAAQGVGLRIGGAVSSVAALVDTEPGTDPLWAVDGDVVLGAGSGATLRPYVFLGAGMQTPAAEDPETDALTHWSWGGGLAVSLFGPASLFGEVRRRTQFDRERPSALAPGSAASELRGGLSIDFGGSAAPERPRRRTRGRRGHDIGAALPAVTLPTSRAGSAVGAQVLPTARRYVGTRYVYGGTSPRTGFDCSGFVQYVFARHDVQLPRTSRQQAGVGTRVEPRVSALRAGDLLFFAESGSRISHVAIYAGSERIIHATSSGGEVRYDDFSTSRGEWFERRMVAARRVSRAGGGDVDLTELVRALERGSLNVEGLALDAPDHAPRPR